MFQLKDVGFSVLGKEKTWRYAGFLVHVYFNGIIRDFFFFFATIQFQIFKKNEFSLMGDHLL